MVSPDVREYLVLICQIRFSFLHFIQFIRYIFQVMTQAAVAILEKDGRILACQRRKISRYGLKWEFPGGKLEPGETPLDCVRRELREELSVEILSISKTESRRNTYADGGSFEVTYFFVSQFSGTPVNNSFETIRWVTLEELKALDVLEGNRPIIESMESLGERDK